MGPLRVARFIACLLHPLTIVYNHLLVCSVQNNCIFVLEVTVLSLLLTSVAIRLVSEMSLINRTALSDRRASNIRFCCSSLLDH